MSHQHNRIVLAGKAASGKDHLRKRMESRGFVYGPSWTTRPMRPGEVDGVDYHFIEPDTFQSMIETNQFYEWVTFNGWHYGTSNDQWYGECNLFIMTPHGVSKIKPEDRPTTFIIFTDIDQEIRRERLLARNDNNDKIERRIQADEIDFANFTDFDLRIKDPNF